eukprot:NODE_76_length_23837_cov_1.242396.p18 type:complete len:138 gc:universal NODE_76_length_23837_cov_1.242396:8591-9004(+)
MQSDTKILQLFHLSRSHQFHLSSNSRACFVLLNVPALQPCDNIPTLNPCSARSHNPWNINIQDYDNPKHCPRLLLSCSMIQQWRSLCQLHDLLHTCIPKNCKQEHCLFLLLLYTKKWLLLHFSFQQFLLPCNTLYCT